MDKDDNYCAILVIPSLWLPLIQGMGGQEKRLGKKD
jgi:hypothetical protein